MVVKFIKSDDLLTLQDKVNDFIIEKDKELREKDLPAKFDVKIEVIPRYSITDPEYFIAVIQY